MLRSGTCYFVTDLHLLRPRVQAQQNSHPPPFMDADHTLPIMLHRAAKGIYVPQRALWRHVMCHIFRFLFLLINSALRSDLHDGV